MKKIMIIIIIIMAITVIISGCRDSYKTDKIELPSNSKDNSNFTDRVYNLKDKMAEETITYDEIIEIMGMEPDIKISAADKLIEEQSSIKDEYLKDAYHYLYEKYTQENEPEDVTYYKYAYDYLEEATLDYMNRYNRGLVENTWDYKQMVYEEAHPELFLRAADFLNISLWKWPMDTGTNSYGHYIIKSLSNFEEEFKNGDLDGFICEWNPEFDTKQTVQNLVAYFDKDGILMDIDYAQLIVD